MNARIVHPLIQLFETMEMVENKRILLDQSPAVPPFQGIGCQIPGCNIGSLMLQHDCARKPRRPIVQVFLVAVLAVFASLVAPFNASPPPPGQALTPPLIISKT